MTGLVQRVAEELEDAPEDVQREVLDFVTFVKARRRADEAADLLPLAATAWHADAARAEEDEAWRDL